MVGDKQQFSVREASCLRSLTIAFEIVNRVERYRRPAIQRGDKQPITRSKRVRDHITCYQIRRSVPVHRKLLDFGLT
jgi:hypothetical protein